MENLPVAQNELPFYRLSVETVEGSMITRSTLAEEGFYIDTESALGIVRIDQPLPDGKPGQLGVVAQAELESGPLEIGVDSPGAQAHSVASGTGGVRG